MINLIASAAIYLELFRYEASLRDIDLPPTIDIEFKNLSPNVGKCEMGVIYLDPVYWENASDNVRESLMFHELGHCMLRQIHYGTGIMEGAVHLYTKEERTTLLNNLFGKVVEK